jgi:hypothetical protein
MNFCRHLTFLTLSCGAIVCCRPMPCPLHPVREIDPQALEQFLDAKPL